MAGVKLRQRVALAEIERIQDVLEAGAVIEGLAPSVSQFELEPLREAPLGADLQRVVVRVADRILREDTAEDGHAVGRTARAGRRLAERRGVGAKPDHCNA